MYRIPKYRVELVREGSQVSEYKSVCSPGDAASVIEAYLRGVDREHFIVLLLNTKNRLIGINTVSVGSLDLCIAHPREVFKPAILANAAGIIIAHNHPSGDTTPSRDDVELSKRIKDAGEILGIPLLDSIIVGDGPFYSLKENGLI